jgi:hypothetical protein
MKKQPIVPPLLVQNDCVLAPGGGSAADRQDVIPRWQVAEIDRDSKSLCSSIPCRGACGVNDRLTDLVSELYRVQAVLRANGKLDAEIELCPPQVWGE